MEHREFITVGAVNICDAAEIERAVTACARSSHGDLVVIDVPPMLLECRLARVCPYEPRW
jgi:hypothetical protein